MINLPEEVLLHIFSYLSMRDLAETSRVSKDWHRLSGDDYLWGKFINPFLFQNYQVSNKLNNKNIVKLFSKNFLKNEKFINFCHENLKPWQSYVKENSSLDRPLISINPSSTHFQKNFLFANAKRNIEIYFENKKFILKDGKSNNIIKEFNPPKILNPKFICLDDWILVHGTNPKKLNRQKITLVSLDNGRRVTLHRNKILSMPDFSTIACDDNYLILSFKDNVVGVWDLNSEKMKIKNKPYVIYKSLNGDIKYLGVYQDLFIILTKQLLIYSAISQQLIYSCSLPSNVKLVCRENNNIIFFSNNSLYSINLDHTRPEPTLLVKLTNFHVNIPDDKIKLTSLTLKKEICYWGNNLGDIGYCLLNKNCKTDVQLGNEKTTIFAFRHFENSLMALGSNNKIAIIDSPDQIYWIDFPLTNYEIFNAEFFGSRLYLSASDLEFEDGKLSFCYDLKSIYLPEREEEKEEEKEAGFSSVISYVSSFFGFK